MASRKSSSGGGGGSVVAIVIGVLLAVAAYLLYQKFYKPPVPVAMEAPSPTPILETPTPTPTPTPPPAPIPEPAATPKPVVQVTPAPEALPSLTKLERRQLPLQVKLLKPVAFSIVVNGQRAGVANAPAGVMVRLVGIRSEESIDVQFQQTVQTVPAASTDIFERVRSLSRFTADQVATPPPAKFAGFEKPKAARAARKPAEPMRPGSLLQEDFDSGTGWADLVPEAVGTIDEAGSKDPSLGLRSNSALSSGPLAVKSGDADLGLLTLAFSLSANAARPVTVRVESFDAGKRRTGGLETLIYPAAPDFYQRYALDLSQLKPSGDGKFVPKSPFMGFSFSIDAVTWKGVEKPEIRLDNVHYAKPAFYVSAKGKDGNDGRSETDAFATPQKALDESGPGDIIVVMDGTYSGSGMSVASFKQTGIPAAWITLKNYPGHKPLISAVGIWNAVIVGESGLAYLEVRGLHVRGDSDQAKKKYADLIGKPDPHTNGNGISVDGRKAAEKPHHIRFADNNVEYCAGGGLGAMSADWMTIENNVIRNNCWWMIYAGSGISYLEGSNFDGTEGTYRRLVRNNIVSGNECKVMWAKIGKFSDGNGIIIDTSIGGDAPDYTGRTLVQNNLVFNNGGSGIHAYRSALVDIINNTAYLNSASPELEYAQIFAARSNDVRFINNIAVAPVAKGEEKPEKVNGGGKGADVIFSHNLYFGGNGDPEMGRSDRFNDPKFVNPSIDPATADFHLKPGSPAIGSAKTEDFMPFLDLDGKPRGTNPDKGAYQSK